MRLGRAGSIRSMFRVLEIYSFGLDLVWSGEQHCTVQYSDCPYLGICPQGLSNCLRILLIHPHRKNGNSHTNMNCTNTCQRKWDFFRFIQFESLIIFVYNIFCIFSEQLTKYFCEFPIIPNFSSNYNELLCI